jgi:predicted  nucleic acid-binding Zn-ribbon protein
MAALRVFGGALLLLVQAAFTSKVTPLQKVMEMLDDMTAKGKQMKHDEEVEFAAFHSWCNSLWDEKEKSIKEAAAEITQLEADIAEAEASAEQLAEEIKELEAAIAKAEKELAEAKALRAKEKADYDAQATDFSESIDALERAIQVLKSREADVPQSLAQVRDDPKIPAHAKSVLTAFLEMSQAPVGSQEGVPEANAYEFQSGGVVALMEKLRHKFQDQLLALQKAEMNAKANFEELAQGLEDNIEYDTKTAKDKTARRAERLEDAAKAKGDLEVTKKTKAEDEKILSDTLAECDAKSKEYEQNQVVRKEELVAIKKAYDILASPEVTGNADKYLPKLVQKATSLAQLSSQSVKENNNRQKAAAYLQQKAKKLGSQYLAMMAMRVTADPFAKVKTMIKDLIVKLMEQANAEADQNAFCSAELATNKQTRENKAAKVEDLSATADKLTADIELLAEEITKLAEDIATILREQEEATRLRAEEKAVNLETIADAKEGQTGVERAIKVLREFYAKADEAFIQEPYKGMQNLKGGVLGLMEVCLSDFARLETETVEAEDSAQSSYEKYMAESTESKEVKEVEKEHKEGNKATAEDDLRATKKELGVTQEELDAALEYFEKLKQDCIDTGLSYEERVRAREEEIQSLQEALAILQGEDIA